MDEKIDILDELGEKTGRVAWKSEAHRDGLWHRCFHLWIVDPGDASEGPSLFVQRRALGKETWPNRLDVTAAGHLMAGESGLDGLRELEEELGLLVGTNEVTSLGTRRNELAIPAGMDPAGEGRLARALDGRDDTSGQGEGQREQESLHLVRKIT